MLALPASDDASGIKSSTVSCTGEAGPTRGDDGADVVSAGPGPAAGVPGTGLALPSLADMAGGKDDCSIGCAGECEAAVSAEVDLDHPKEELRWLRVVVVVDETLETRWLAERRTGLSSRQTSTSKNTFASS